mgnify:CR=1 FL=1
MTQLAAFKKMKELMTLYYIEAKTSTAKPVAWLTSGAPVVKLLLMPLITSGSSVSLRGVVPGSIPPFRRERSAISSSRQ